MAVKAKNSELPFRMPEKDSETRISRATLSRMAELRGTSETEVLHFAARRLADEILPLYEPDEGALTEKQLQRVQELAKLPELGDTCSSLFEE